MRRRRKIAPKAKNVPEIAPKAKKSFKNAPKIAPKAKKCAENSAAGETNVWKIVHFSPAALFSTHFFRLRRYFWHIFSPAALFSAHFSPSALFLAHFSPSVLFLAHFSPSALFLGASEFFENDQIFEQIEFELQLQRAVIWSKNLFSENELET